MTSGNQAHAAEVCQPWGLTALDLPGGRRRAHLAGFPRN